MARVGKTTNNFASVETQKLNHHCPHYKGGFCTRQQRQCNNKDVFFESCIIFKGNNVLKFFMKPRRYFYPNIPLEQEMGIAEEKID